MQSRGVYFDGRTATLRQVTDDKLVTKCPVVDGLYRLQIVAPTAFTTATASAETSKPNPLPKTLPKASLMEWHSRLGHISLDRVQALAKAGHITITDNNKELCTSCGPAKSKQQISREPQRRATSPFERIHKTFLDQSQYQAWQAIGMLLFLSMTTVATGGSISAYVNP